MTGNLVRKVQSELRVRDYRLLRSCKFRRTRVQTAASLPFWIEYTILFCVVSD